MRIADMLTDLDVIEAKAERINEGLKDKPQYSRDNRLENVWTAYSTSGDIVTKAKMLRTCLLRAQAEGHE